MSVKADIADVFGLLRKLANTVLAGETLKDFEAALAEFEEGHTRAGVADVADGVADALGGGDDDQPPTQAPEPTTPTE